jgi:chemotaxis protein MotA
MGSTAWIGLLVGIGGVALGMVLEGGHLASLLQPTAFLIVTLGTLGAVLVGSRKEDLELAVRLAKWALNDSRVTGEAQRSIAEIVDLAQLARRESILSIEARIGQISSPFAANAMRMVVDGVDPSTLRSMLKSQVEHEEDKMLAGAKVFSDAGGYAPTVGILGAVLGLIHVMENLTDTSKLGAGIAVAFVATVYGVGSANLILLPLAHRIRRKVMNLSLQRNITIEGAVGILTGLSPLVIEEKLKAMSHEPQIQG